MNNQETASIIACEAQSFMGKLEDNQFPMFSFDRIARTVIKGLVEQMLDDGCTEKEAIEALRSKDIRWMLDQQEDFLIETAKLMAKIYGLSESAKKGYD